MLKYLIFYHDDPCCTIALDIKRMYFYTIVVHGDESAYTNVATVHALFNIDDNGATSLKEDTGNNNKLNNQKNAPKKGCLQNCV